MVCEKCEKKLSKVIVPDKWKERWSQDQRKQAPLQEEKTSQALFGLEWYLNLFAHRRWTPYGNTKFIICKQQVHQDGKYCHTCAYTKGVCAMCGKQVLDTKVYKQSNV